MNIEVTNPDGVSVQPSASSTAPPGRRRGVTTEGHGLSVSSNSNTGGTRVSVSSRIPSSRMSVAAKKEADAVTRRKRRAGSVAVSVKDMEVPVVPPPPLASELANLPIPEELLQAPSGRVDASSTTLAVDSVYTGRRSSVSVHSPSTPGSHKEGVRSRGPSHTPVIPPSPTKPPPETDGAIALPQPVYDSDDEPATRTGAYQTALASLSSVEMEGWVMKRDRRGVYHQRYLFFHGSFLVYYQDVSSSSGDPLGIVSLDAAVSVKTIVDTQAPCGRAISVTTPPARSGTPSREFVFTHNDIQIMNDWHSLLARRVAAIRYVRACRDDNTVPKQELLSLLAGQGTLEQFHIRGSSMSTAAASAIATYVIVSRNLTKLTLAGAQLGDVGCREICVGLSSSPILLSLDLSRNLIGLDGSKSLAEALCDNSSLTRLDLSSNRLHDQGVTALVGALAMHSLTVLRLAGNDIGDVGASAIALALEASSHGTTGSGTVAVRELALGDNNIGDQGVSRLANALKKNSQLGVLDLSNNCFGDDGARAIASAISDPTCPLADLNAHANVIRDEGAFALGKALGVNTTLTRLDVGGNPFGRAGFLAITTADPHFVYEQVAMSSHSGALGQSVVQRRPGSDHAQGLLVPDAPGTTRFSVSGV